MASNGPPPPTGAAPLHDVSPVEMLIDQYLPAWDVREYRDARVSASPDAAYAAFRDLALAAGWRILEERPGEDRRPAPLPAVLARVQLRDSPHPLRGLGPAAA